MSRIKKPLPLAVTVTPGVALTVLPLTAGDENGTDESEQPPDPLIRVQAPPTTTVSELQAAVAEALGIEPKRGLLRRKTDGSTAGRLAPDRAVVLPVTVGAPGTAPSFVDGSLQLPDDMSLLRYYNSLVNRRSISQAARLINQPGSLAEVSNGRLQFPDGPAVSFQRTLRVPETEKQCVTIAC